MTHIAQNFASKVSSYREADEAFKVEHQGLTEAATVLYLSLVTDEWTTEQVRWAFFSFGAHTFASYLDHLGHFDVATIVRQALLPLVYGDTEIDLRDNYRVAEEATKLQKSVQLFDRAFHNDPSRLDSEAAQCLVFLSSLAGAMGCSVLSSRLESARQMIMLEW